MPTKPDQSSDSRYLPIEDYGIIGDLHTVALVGKNGSIDWCCIPALDAPSVFGALLDAERGGHFRIAPADLSGTNQKQYYLPETNILVTRFLTTDGATEVTDFMPIQAITTSTRHRIMRAVRVVSGSLTVELTCRPAFNYARDRHSVEVSPAGATFRGTELTLSLFSSVPVVVDGRGGVGATFKLGRASPPTSCWRMRRRITPDRPTIHLKYIKRRCARQKSIGETGCDTVNITAGGEKWYIDQLLC